MAETRAYDQAARTGMYEKPKGLLGKYDNVRRFWEDRVTARALAPSFRDLMARKGQAGRGVRVLDLGCGSGDGLELMTSIPQDEPNGYSDGNCVLPAELIDTYLGVDINEDLICQAEACHGTGPNVRFIQADLSDGLPASVKELPPFDVYFAGYGTLSHFHDDRAARIIADIAAHSADGAIFVGDWLGRYSYEWQDLWDNPVDREYFMDYRISYIYPEEERGQAEISSFPLRLMTDNEILHIVREAASLSGTELVPTTFVNRSVFVGRHTDTKDYNGNCPRLRSAVNSLFEQAHRTDLDSLIVDYVPAREFDELNRFFSDFFHACNSLVRYTRFLMDTPDAAHADTVAGRNSSGVPAALTHACDAMRSLVQSLRDVEWCDVRANFIEPMLAYQLRMLETSLQQCSGTGHGLVGVFHVNKGQSTG